MRFVIHAVGPIWRGGGQGEAELLAGAYQGSLRLAVAHGCDSVALPALSTGVYGYPLPQAAEVTVRTIHAFLAEHPGLTVRLVLHGEGAVRAFREAEAAWGGESRA